MPLKKMKKEKIHQLIEKYLNGQSTPEEEQALMDWYDSYQNKKDFTDSLNENEQQLLKSSMLQNIERNITNSKKVKVRNFSVMYRWAAAITLLIIIAFAAMYQLPESATITYQTSYGEIQKFTLPDGSTVTLNGNSSLSFNEDMNKEPVRKVWLEGEGFFEVTHQTNNQAFIVNFSDRLQVEVLGTEFNVTQRKSGVSVVLKSGSVKLHMSLPLGVGLQKKEVFMEPGEVVKITDNQAGFTKEREENIDMYYAWMHEKLVLDNTTLEEIILMLYETYGLNIVVEENALLERSASGSMPLLKEPNQLLNNIAALYNLDLAPQKQEETILLKAQKDIE